ncbi:hypothetical protein NKR19_g1751 [Coniochaeta hoffmannii]|uniref:Uncharacterized protein n=1 Tax=Coniochaeta hoffmannii TaxID=91930 RepID=A0AA38W332_9PEZI|nr:hypothetical protein NKR19_g1751 [Coniochaeta hoffmannii]
MPYCIWYPGFATEDTYRALARQNPVLRYNVGRACAVGGCLDLYLELDLLPDVTIAEEAREAGKINNSEGSTAIFNHIMSQPVRYRVMNDYDRTINIEDPEPGAYLNGDTALRRRLAEGDGRIVMAAYEGNVDRYSRLRRPRKFENEEEAIVHGVYHSTTFAKYWSLPNEQGHFGDFRAQNAIMARFIMINDLSWLSEEPDPTDLGDPRDYPPSYALACIAGGYQWTYDMLEVRPTTRLLQQAMKSPNTHYVADLRRRAAELGLEDELPDIDRFSCWYWQEDKDLFPTTTLLIPIQYTSGIVDEYGGGSPYERSEIEANASPWELYIASSDELRDRADEVAETARPGMEAMPLYEEMKDWKQWLPCLPWKNKEAGDEKIVEEKTAAVEGTGKS